MNDLIRELIEHVRQEMRTPAVPPSTVVWLYCQARHGGEYRVHHHGVEQAYRSLVVTRVEELA